MKAVVQHIWRTLEEGQRGIDFLKKNNLGRKATAEGRFFGAVRILLPGVSYRKLYSCSENKHPLGTGGKVHREFSGKAYQDEEFFVSDLEEANDDSFPSPEEPVKEKENMTC